MNKEGCQIKESLKCKYVLSHTQLKSIQKKDEPVKPIQPSMKKRPVAAYTAKGLLFFIPTLFQKVVKQTSETLSQAASRHKHSF